MVISRFTIWWWPTQSWHLTIWFDTRLGSETNTLSLLIMTMHRHGHTGWSHWSGGRGDLRIGTRIRGELSCQGWTRDWHHESVVMWGGSDVWQVTSGWRQDWRQLFFIFYDGRPFFGGKWRKKSLKTGSLEGRGDTVYVYRTSLVGYTVKTHTTDMQTVDSDYSKTIHQEMNRIIRPKTRVESGYSSHYEYFSCHFLSIGIPGVGGGEMKDYKLKLIYLLGVIYC